MRSGERRPGRCLLGLAVGHHTHDADHEQRDANAGDGEHSLLVELLRFWKGMRTRQPSWVPDPRPDLQLKSWHAALSMFTRKYTRDNSFLRQIRLKVQHALRHILSIKLQSPLEGHL